MKIEYELSTIEEHKLFNWMETRPKRKSGASGGRYTYMITYTTIGTVIRVRDAATDEEFDLTDYSTW